MKSKKIIVVAGPTAIGKTDEAIRLAKSNLCPIVSADSRQVYTELDIAVAKPDQIQLNEVEHFLIGHVSIHHEYNAGIYAKEARTLINQLFHTYSTLIVCGGTGLYLKALFDGLDVLPGKNEKLRTELQIEMEENGLEALQQKLKNIDIHRFEKTDIKNPQRLIRAIEIAVSGEIKSADIPEFEHEFEKEMCMMEMEREELYQRINQRVDRMIDAGLEAEAKRFYPLRELNALQTVGYSEWWPYFEGEYKLENVIDKIKQHSRNYAKRQITWFKHQSK